MKIEDVMMILDRSRSTVKSPSNFLEVVIEHAVVFSANK